MDCQGGVGPRFERIKAGLARRKAEGKPVGRQAGAVDKGQRKRGEYVAAWEDEDKRRERLAKRASTRATAPS